MQPKTHFLLIEMTRFARGNLSDSLLFFNNCKSIDFLPYRRTKVSYSWMLVLKEHLFYSIFFVALAWSKPTQRSRRRRLPCNWLRSITSAYWSRFTSSIRLGIARRADVQMLCCSLCRYPPRPFFPRTGLCLGLKIIRLVKSKSLSFCQNIA